MNEDSIRAVIKRRYGSALRYDKFHIAINSAIEIYLRRCGQDIVLVGVVHHYNQRVVLAIFQEGCNLKRKGSPATAMLSRVVTVYKHIGNALHTIKFHKQAFV